MTASAPLRQTALHAAHHKLGARLVEFGGWSMPVQYSGIVDEHRAVREAAGVFDISHMGELFVRGEPDAALGFLRRILTHDAARLGDGRGQYTLLLNEAGGVIDDLILYRLGPGDYFLVVNAARVGEDRAWLERHLPPGVTLDDASDRTAALALQGPRAEEIARRLFGPAQPLPPRNAIAACSWNCQEVRVARTGYTGEDGFELFLPNELAEPFFLHLLEIGQPLGLKPCGLGARDTLRLEACLPLNGSDLSPARTPLEAGLGAFVVLERDVPFVGHEALRRQQTEGLPEKLAAFRMTGKGPPPRAHYALFLGAERVGEATSGAPSPTLGCGIGLAYVRAALAVPGTRLELEIRGARVPVEIVKKPFYKRPAAASIAS